VTKPETYADALVGCDAVINLVGIIREFPGRGITYQRLHVQATEHLLRVTAAAGVRRYLHMSALGARAGAPSTYHRSKFQAEELVRSSGLDWTIFRPSVIFGPKDDFINKLAGLVSKLPIVPVIGSGTYRLQPIAGDDVARCFTMALTMPETIGAAYDLCGCDPLTYRELLAAIGAVFGKHPVRTVSIPPACMMFLARLLQRFPLFPVTPDQIRMLLEESLCDGSWRGIFPFAPVGLTEAIHVYLQRS
jgi:uncharacterized protein YbjT (DUF2867 family)